MCVMNMFTFNSNGYRDIFRLSGHVISTSPKCAIVGVLTKFICQLL